MVERPFPKKPVSWLHLNQEQRTDLKENRKETPLAIFHPSYLQEHGGLKDKVADNTFLEKLAGATRSRVVFLFADQNGATNWARD